MSKEKSKRGWWAAGIVVVAIVAGVAVWQFAPSQPTATQPARSPQPAPLPSTATVATPAAPAGVSDAFGVLSCQTRQYQGSLALALTFTQPVDRKANFDQYVDVLDGGVYTPPKSNDDDASQTASDSQSANDDGASDKTNANAASAKPKTASTAAASTGSRVNGQWVVGDNPRVLYFPYAVVPLRHYVVRVKNGLPATSADTRLPAATQCEVDTQAMPPAYYFASKGVVLPAGQNGGLPVATVNVPEVDVQFLRVEPARVPEFFDLLTGRKRGDGGDGDDDSDDGGKTSLQGAVYSWSLQRLQAITSSVYQGRFLTDDKPNRRHVTFLPVEGIKELQEPGIYVAVMTQPGRFSDNYQVTYFYVSDIGLHTRRYTGRIEAYSVSLKTGQPISGDTVELVDGNGKPLAKAAADASGHVRFDGDFSKAAVIRASRGNEMTVLSLRDPALDLSEFDVGGYPAINNNLFVYSGRHLYRPGETFNVSVLPRDASARMLPSVPLTATIKRPDGRVVSTALWQPSQDMYGYVQHAITLPQDAPAGRWLLELRVDPASRAADSAWVFRVEDFLPERMKLTLDAPAGPLRGLDAFEVNAQGDYLYGAPAGGNRLLGTFSIKRDRLALPQQWPGFLFGDFNDDAIKIWGDLDASILNAQGKADLGVDLNEQLGKKKFASPLTVRVTASLLESGGRPVVRAIERDVWPADKLIAVRPLFANDVTGERAPASFEAVRVDAQGHIAPLQNATLRLYLEHRDYYWRYDDQRGWNSGYTQTDELVDSRAVPLTNRLSFSEPVDYGSYRLEISDPETGQTFKYRFYAGWDAQSDEAMGNRPDHVQMRLEGLPAKPGGKATLTFTPPHDGQALVTVEGDRMLWSTWVTAKASGTQVDIPIDPAWNRHDLYVSVVAFRPGSQGDRVTPARAVGLAYLPLDTGNNKLDVQLTAPAKIEPETRQTVKVKVQGAASKRVVLTLSAVDEGILSVDQFTTPDPYDFYYGKHRYAPELLDMYGKLIEKMDGTLGRLKWGGDAALRGNGRSLPKRVKLVDLFSGPVTLDDKGEAAIPLNIPDFNGTLRLMAVAFTDDHYGNAQADMVVAAPVVAELNTPRFITPGDRAAIALDVTNLSGATRTITINLQASDPLALDMTGQNGARTITLWDKQRAILRYDATAIGSYGLGSIRLTVDSPGDASLQLKPLHIVRESVLQVQPSQGPRSKTYRQRIAPGGTFAPLAQWTDGYYPDSVTVNLALSDKPPINVKPLVRDLLGYPYGCTEQTVSAAMPWLLIDPASAAQYGLKPFTEADRQAKVNKALERLSGMRGASGAYSLWGTDGSSADLWLTAYATSFLQEARDHGYSVPDAVVNRSRNWMLQQLQQNAHAFGTWSADLRRDVQAKRVTGNEAGVLRDDHRRFANLAYAALTLARDGKAPLSTVRQLYDNYQERARSPLPLVQLAAAFKLMGDDKRMKAALDQAMTRPYGIGPLMGAPYYDYWMGDYGSAARDLALSYALMNQYGLQHERRETLLIQLSGILDNRSYFSTQEQLALLLAARAAGGTAGAPWEATLTTSTDHKVLQGGNDQSLELQPTALAATSIANTGSQPIYAEFDVQGTPTTPPAPRSDVISVKRGWYWPDGKPWTGGSLQTGDVLVASLDVSAKIPLPDGLVIDRVPAGMEVENLNLTQNPDMNDWKIDNQTVSDAMSSPAIKHTEFRDDRYVAAVSLGGDNASKVRLYYLLRVVTPGTYTVPSTVVESMYSPEQRGVSEPWRNKIEIRDRVVPPAAK